MKQYNRLKRIWKGNNPSQITVTDQDDETVSFIFLNEDNKSDVVIMGYSNTTEVRMPVSRLRKLLDEGEKMAKREPNG